jgi:hypothetical protein
VAGASVALFVVRGAGLLEELMPPS